MPQICIGCISPVLKIPLSSYVLICLQDSTEVAGIVTQQVKSPALTPAPTMRAISSPGLHHCQHIWESSRENSLSAINNAKDLEFQASTGFGVVQPQHCSHLRSEPVKERGRWCVSSSPPSLQLQHHPS